MNAKPEHWENYSADDTKVAEPETEWGPIKDREGYM